MSPLIWRSNFLKLNVVLIDVLVVGDTSHKPYYLIEKYRDIYAHHIYTRVCDTNTPIIDAAQPLEIKRMWRERFGMDLVPLKRVKPYLSDLDAWVLSNRAGKICTGTTKHFLNLR